MTSRPRAAAARAALVVVAGIAAALAAAVLPRAFATRDVQVLRDQDVRSTIKPAAEVESFLVDVPPGAQLRAVVTSRAPKLKVGLDVAYAEDPAPDAVARGRRAQRTYPAEEFPRTRRIVVAGDGSRSGDYSLRVTWKTKRRMTVLQKTPETLGLPFLVSGERGTRLRFRITGTDVLGGKLDSYLTGAAFVPDRGEVVLPAPGTYQFAPFTPTFAHPPGRYRVTVEVIPPTPDPRKLDLTDARFGGRRKVSRVIGRGGGRLDVPDLEAAANIAKDISGSGVDVPEDAVPVDTLFEIETGFGIDVPVPGLYAVGSAVLYRAEDRTFDRDVTTTIPFDASAFGGDTGKVRVFTQKEDGTILEVQGVVIDVAKGTLSFPTPHFSSFQVFGDAPVLRSAALSGSGTSRLRRAAPGRASFVSGKTLYEVELATGGLLQPTAPPARSAAADPDGGYFVATTSNQVVRSATVGGLLLLAGTGQPGSDGDGGPPLAARMRPVDVAVEGPAKLLIVDAGASALRRIDTAVPRIDQVAVLGGMRTVCVAADGAVFVTTDDAVWRLNPAQDGFDRVAGVGGGTALGAGDGGPLGAVRFGLVADVSASPGDAGGLVLHVADAGRHCIWRLDLSRDRGYIVAGEDGQPGFAGDAPAGTPPGRFRNPSGIAWLGSALDVAVLDDGNQRLRTLTAE